MKTNYVLIAFTLFISAVNAQIHIGPTQTYTNIQAACPFIQPGDTVYIHAGTYAGYQYYDGLKGNANNWITITRYKNEYHEIRGGWQLSNMEYVKMEKLKFKANPNFPSSPLNIDNKGDCAFQSKHVVLDSCYFLDVTAGGNTIKFGGVDEFEVKNCIIKNNTGSSSGAGLALNVCHNGKITGCLFENIEGKAIQAKLGTRNVTIEKNLIKSCGNLDAALKIGEAGGWNFHCAGDNWLAREIKIYANIIIGGRASWSIAQASDCEFTNNTCINPTQFVTRVLADDPSVPCTTNVIKNNIFYLTQTRYFNGSAGGTSSNIDYSTHTYQNNLFYYTADGSWTPNPTSGAYDTEEIAGTVFINNLSGNPLFTNVASNDFHLQAGSAAIATGASTTKPNVDYYGMLYKTPRAVGASEYNSTPASITNHNIESQLLSIYPNPTSDFILISANEKYKTGNALIEIFDINGKRVSSFNTLLMNTAIPINISELNNGSYFIRLSAELGNWQQKFVVVK